MEAFRLVKKRWLFSDCSGEFAIHDYASSNVYQIQVKDESISIERMESPPFYLPNRFTGLRTKSEL